MRVNSFLVLGLSALVVAEEQIPLGEKVKAWFNKATSYVSSASSAIPSPLDAGAKKVAEHVVHSLTLENWKGILIPSKTAAAFEPTEWLIFVDGANKTCYGLCANATLAFNESAALLSAEPKAPNFARLNCEAEPILCNLWALGPPSIYHMLIPNALPEQAEPPTVVRYMGIRRSASVAEARKNITTLITEEKIKEVPIYEGAYHPFNGWVATTPLGIPLAYVSWAMSLMPTWAPMIVVSLGSRFLMNRRMPTSGGPDGRPAAQAPR